MSGRPTRRRARDPNDVLYTSDEKSKNSALLVRASSDGNDSDANLYLTETGRFAGTLPRDT